MSPLSHLLLLSLLLLLFPSTLSQPPPCPCTCFPRSSMQAATEECTDPAFSHCRLGICDLPNNAQSRHCCNPTNNQSISPAPSFPTDRSTPTDPSPTPLTPSTPSPVSSTPATPLPTPSTSAFVSPSPSSRVSSSSSFCPCQCLSRRFSGSAFDQCDRPQFAACAVSFCTRRNGSVSRQCCNRRITPLPSPSPSPSVSRSAAPSPPPPNPDFICPCVCFNPANLFIATEQCSRLRFSNCAVQRCTLPNGGVSKQCCNPGTGLTSVSPSAPPAPAMGDVSGPPCPCICRTGVVRVRAAERECRSGFYPSTCRVEGCRNGFRNGAACCDGNDKTARPSANPNVVVGACPCKCRTGLFAEDSGRIECNRTAFFGRCAVRGCFKGRGGVPGFECC